MFSLFKNISGNIFASAVRNPAFALSCNLHTSVTLHQSDDKKGPTHFLSYNKKIYPPQAENEEPRKAFVCHQRENIKYSPDKMWYIASMIRGMTIDEAIRQLRFCEKGAAPHVLETVLEAQEMAVRDHNVEFKSNLWVAESFCGKGLVIKGIRRHAKKRVGHVEYKYCHYFVRLEEGKPPKDYYGRMVTPEQQLEKWLAEKRKRKISNSL